MEHNFNVSLMGISHRFFVKHICLLPHTFDQSTMEERKVKVTLVQALRLCTGRTAHRGSRGIALPFHDHGTRRG